MRGAPWRTVPFRYPADRDRIPTMRCSAGPRVGGLGARGLVRRARRASDDPTGLELTGIILVKNLLKEI